MVKAVELTEKNGYFKVWDGKQDVSLNTGKISKDFKCFLELGPQTAHDSGLHKLYQEKFKDKPLRPHEGQVEKNNLGLPFYENHGEQSAKIAAAYFGWASQGGLGNNNAFVPKNNGNKLSIQKHPLRNGYSYDVTAWWEADGIYTSFHCYPNEGGKRPTKTHWVYKLC